jgi:hypothetical protein
LTPVAATVYSSNSNSRHQQHTAAA